MPIFHLPKWFDILFISLTMLYALAGLTLVPLHGDEPTLIYMGRDFYYHLQGQHDSVFYEDWDALSPEAATQQQLRLVNGTVSKYLYGAVAYLSGYALADINEQWSWGSGWDWNHENGHVPSDDLLFRMRLVSAIQLALSMPVLFAIAYHIGGRGVAYIALLYYALNPAVLLNGRRAMMEGSFALFSLLAVLAALLLIKERKWYFFLLLALASGLAVASKHTAVVTVAALFAGLGFYDILKHWKNRWELFQQLDDLMAAGAGAILVFFLLSPALWDSEPLVRIREILTMRRHMLTGQVSAFGGYANVSEQLQGFFRQALMNLPVYSEVNFDGFLDRQTDVIQAYQQSGFAGVSLGGSIVGAFLVGLFVLIGCVILWKKDLRIRLLVFTWAIATLILVVLITPLEWQRYYLPIYPVIAVLLGLGIQGVFEQVRQRWHTG